MNQTYSPEEVTGTARLHHLSFHFPLYTVNISISLFYNLYIWTSFLPNTAKRATTEMAQSLRALDALATMQVVFPAAA